MEYSMNVAQKLLNACEGTKLYSPLFGEVALFTVSRIHADRDDYAGIEVKVKAIGMDVTRAFLNDGRYYGYKDAECLLFPSKDMRDWSCVNFKKDLPVGTLCLVADTNDFIRCDGSLEVCLGNIRIYEGKGRCRADRDSNVTFAWNHIIPISEIDFNNPIYNKNHDYGKSVD